MLVDSFIPHKAPIKLIDQLLEHSDGSVVTRAIIGSDNLFYDAGLQGVPSWTAIEYLAQTAATWVGLQVSLEADEIMPAFLVSARQLRVTCPVFAAGSELQIHVDVNFSDGPIVAFYGKILQCTTGEKITVCEAEFSAFRPDNLDEYLATSEPRSIEQRQE